ncbi:MAG: methylenetetrahydrofolate reductase [NAD(P)H] [Proteobacteria bacterium]|nr:methylenetetrahydrofolate reductase [NAD(P)H] [Pseudomonadota bacterium]
MHVSDLYRRGEPILSFEFFPPKTDAGFRTLRRTIEDLKQLDPGFVSVTMGAGGSTRAKTVDLVTEIQSEVGVTAMAHLPCTGFERAEVSVILDRLEQGGLANVLALRGDPPQGESTAPPRGAFAFANELTAFIRERGDFFCIGGACYPETHPEAESPEADLANLVQKVEAGADFLITQLFFDNEDYFGFVTRARASGIEVPIVPGIMPITSAANIRRITNLCGARIPRDLERELGRVDADDEATAALGVEWATQQCRELLERGAPGVHFYTLNRSPATRQIHRALF